MVRSHSGDGFDEVEGHEQVDSYVLFLLGAEYYALEVSRVREVLDVAAFTRVPGGTKALIGLYNLRGQVIPVWNLRVLFRLGEEAITERAPSILMVEPDPAQPSRLAGLMVDAVSDVMDFPAQEVQPPPSLGMGVGADYVRGLVRHQDRFVLVLDLDRIFAALTETGAPDAPRLP